MLSHLIYNARVEFQFDIKFNELEFLLNIFDAIYSKINLILFYIFILSLTVGYGITVTCVFHISRVYVIPMCILQQSSIARLFRELTFSDNFYIPFATTSTQVHQVTLTSRASKMMCNLACQKMNYSELRQHYRLNEFAL